MEYFDSLSEEKIRVVVRNNLLEGIDDLNIVEKYISYILTIKDNGKRLSMVNLLIRFKSIEMAEIQYRYRHGDETAIDDFNELNKSNGKGVYTIY